MAKLGGSYLRLSKIRKPQKSKSEHQTLIGFQIPIISTDYKWNEIKIRKTIAFALDALQKRLSFCKIEIKFSISSDDIIIKTNIYGNFHNSFVAQETTIGAKASALVSEIDLSIGIFHQKIISDTNLEMYLFKSERRKFVPRNIFQIISFAQSLQQLRFDDSYFVYHIVRIRMILENLAKILPVPEIELIKEDANIVAGRKIL